MNRSALITNRTGKIRDDGLKGQPEKPAVLARGREKPGRMNQTEARYATELELRKRAGDIRDWWYEPLKLRLGKKTWYTIDFVVLHNDGLVELVEIKGFLREDAAVKFKAARDKYYLFKFTMLSREKGGGWVERLPE